MLVGSNALEALEISIDRWLSVDIARGNSERGEVTVGVAVAVEWCGNCVEHACLRIEQIASGD